MAKKGSVTVNLKKLTDLYEGLKTRATVQVGVFQDKSARKQGGLTNADLAMYHELGSPAHGLPPRSMLKTPLADHAQQIMAPFIGKAEAYLQKGTIKKMYLLIGIAAEKVVLGAFKTGGYGKWAPLKNSTIWRKLRGSVQSRANRFWNIKAGNTGMGILIDTAELEHSFSSRVRMKI